NCLRFVLQWPDHAIEELLVVAEKRCDYVLACRANGHAISGLIVGAEGQALPHRDGFCAGNLLPVLAGAAAVRDLLNPIAESAHELAVVVRVAGGEVELAVRADRSRGAGSNAKLAFEAGIIRNRMRVLADLRVD